MAETQNVDPEFLTPEFLIAAIEVAKLKDGRKIIHALMSEHIINEFSICLDTKLEYKKADFDSLGLGQFIGTLEDVIIRFQELKGDKIIGVDLDTGKDIKVPHIMPHYWMSELHGAKAYYFVVDTHTGYKAELKANKTIEVEKIKAKPEYKKVEQWVDRVIALQ